MKNIIANKWTTLILAVIAVILATCLIIKADADPVEPVAQEPIVKYVEVIKEEVFDTSIIETQWCGGFTEGTIRMVGAWVYTPGIVEDEQGQLWAVEEDVTADDFLMLWIADNHTPNKTTDDIIVKVWREAH